MTDFETMKAMLDRADIDYKQQPESGGTYEGHLTLTVEAGYIGFVSVLSFNKDTGMLLAVGAYE